MNYAYVWIIWFAAAMISLAAFELYAVTHQKPTLSGTVRRLSARWPLTQGVLCLIAGVLMSHFWWPWTVCP